MELNNFNIDLIKKLPVGLTLETNTLKIINENCYDAIEYRVKLKESTKFVIDLL